MHQRTQLGKKGEGFVAQYLRDNGFTIHAMNYAKRGGEVDVIAQKNEIIAFVEVKTRKNSYFNLSEVVTPSKQRKVVMTAKHYLAEKNLYDVVIRFDVALLTIDNESIAINYVPNAFTQQSEY